MNSKKRARPSGVEARTNKHAPLSGVPYGIHRAGGEFIVYDKKTGAQKAIKKNRKDARQSMKELSNAAGKSNSLTQDGQGVSAPRSGNAARSTRPTRRNTLGVDARRRGSEIGLVGGRNKGRSARRGSQ